MSLSKATRLSIFLSHTSELGKFPEGLSYVAKAKEAIESAGHVAVEMATWGAQSITAEDYCAQRVKECDVYIGIFGNKYGSLTSRGISHTESEYDAAYEAGLRRYIFLLDQDSANTDLPGHALKEDRFTGKRRAFLKRVGKHGIHKLFGNRDHLYSLISDALHGLAEASASVAHGHHGIADPLLSPFRFSAYCKQRSKGFVGRDWWSTQIRNWLQDRSDTQGLLLTAGFGVGKTAFMAQLVENNSTGLPLVAQHFCQGGQNTTLSPGRFVTSIAAQIAENLPAYRRRLQAPDAVALLDQLKNASLQPEDAWNQAVVSLLNDIDAPGIDHLLVVDALELTLKYRPATGEPSDVGISDLLAAGTNLPPWLRILATSRYEDEVVTSLTARHFRHIPIRPDSAENLNDLRTYTVARCQVDSLKAVIKNAKLSSLQVANKLCDPKLSGGKMLYVESVLDGIESGSIPLNSLGDLDRLPHGMRQFYKLTFRRSYPRGIDSDHYKLMQAILSLLCEQREPLGLSELSAILNVPKKQIRTELLNLGALISTSRKESYRGANLASDVYYSFDHSSLRLWLTELDESSGLPLSHPYDIDPKEAEALIRAWALNEISLQHTHQWPYLVRHLRSYLTKDEWLARRHELLGDIYWLQARLTCTSVNELMRDTEEDSVDALDAPNLKLNSFLGQAEQALRLYPSQLPTQILSRLDGRSPVAKIANLCQAAELMCKENQLAIPLFPSLSNTQLLRQIPVHEAVLCLCSFEEQEMVVFGCSNGRVGVWNLRSGSISYSRVGSGHKNVVYSITQVSPTRFASACWDGKVILWSLEDLRQEFEFQAHDEAINALVCCHVDGKSWIVSASDDHSIKVWPLPQPARKSLKRRCVPLHEIESAHNSWVTHLVHLDGCEVASASKDGSIRIWNIREGTYRLSFQLEGEVISLSPQQSSQCLYVVTDPGENLPNQTSRLDLQLAQSERAASLPEDVQSLLCLNYSDSLFFFSESQGSMIFCTTWHDVGLEHRKLGGHDALIECLCRSSGKQQYLISASIDRDRKNQLVSTIAIWDTSERASVAGAPPLQAHHGSVLLIQRNSDDEIYSVAADGSGSLWSPDGIPQAKWRFDDETPKEIMTSSQAYVLTGRQLAIRTGSRIGFYETPTISAVDCDLKAQSPLLSDKARSLELAPTAAAWSDVHGLILGCADGSILHSAFDSTTETISSRVVIGSVELMKMLDQFRLFCWATSSAEDGSFWICDLDTTQAHHKLTNDQQASIIASRAYRIRGEDAHHNSQDMIAAGKMDLLHVCADYLAVAHADASVSVWEWADEFQGLRYKHRLQGHAGSVVAFHILADGSYVTASTDRTIRRWRQNGERMIDAIIFVNDYIPTSLYAAEQSSDQGSPSTLIIVGDEMGLVHWLQLS